MIKEHEMLYLLQQASPSFQLEELEISLDLAGDEVYQQLNRFANHLVDLVNVGNDTVIQQVFSVIEDFLVDGDDQVYDRVVTELLEDIQGISLGEEIPLDKYNSFLKPITQKEWDKLLVFWDDVK